MDVENTKFPQYIQNSIVEKEMTIPLQEQKMMKQHVNSGQFEFKDDTSFCSFFSFNILTDN